MKKIGIFACLMAMAFMTVTGLYLTQHAGEVDAANAGDTLFYNRYFTTSKTPISDLNALTGSSASGTSGQIRIHDGTDFESKTVSGDATLASTGVLTISANSVESSMIAPSNVATSDIADNAITSAKIAIANVANSDIADDAITSAKIAIANVANSDLAASAVTSDKIAIANVQASNFFTNVVTATIAAGQTGADITVEASSLLIDTQPISGFSNLYTLTKSDFAGGVWAINTDEHPVAMVMNGVFIRP